MNSRYKVHFNKILSIVLVCALVSAVFFLPARAEGIYTDDGLYRYYQYNNSDYWLAYWYGLDELPFGLDSGVAYFYIGFTTKPDGTSGRGDLTLCFDKCRYMERFSGDISATVGGVDYILLNDYPNSHIWGMKYNNGFKFSCISDHPVYYTWSNVDEDWKELPWTYCFTSEYTSVADGSGLYTSSTTLYVYVDVDLTTACSLQRKFSNADYGWGLYSNALMINNLSGNWDKTENYSVSFNLPYDSHKIFRNLNLASHESEYIFEAYPTSQALRDWQLYIAENDNAEQLYQQLEILNINLEYLLYQTVDIYSEEIKIREALEALVKGQDYPEGGLFNDTSQSDVIDGAIGSINSDTSASDYIHTLAVSFEFIRKFWDKIVGVFGFGSIIGLLLFLAFVAYLLGRALKGRSD